MLTIAVNGSNLDPHFGCVNERAFRYMTPHEAPSWKGKQPAKVRFGKRLHELRVERGYTQMQLAMNAGLDRSFISDIERGIKEPTVSTLDLIANAFGLTLSELLDGV